MAYDRYGRNRPYGEDYRRQRNAREDYDDERGFFERAGDEVRSWFGDEEAERRRMWDSRQEDDDDDYRPGPFYDRQRGYGVSPTGGFSEERDAENRRAGRGEGWGSRSSGRSFSGSPYGTQGQGRSRPYGSAGRFGRNEPSTSFSSRGSDRGAGSDHDYGSWRQRQIETFDREYDDYRRERQSRFDEDFGSWRQTRQGQRQSLSQVREHFEVIGSDGQHVGTVDKVKGDRIKLTKADQDSEGRHHYVPCAWITTVEGDKVMLNKTADEAHRVWTAEQNEDDERSAFSVTDRFNNPY